MVVVVGVLIQHVGKGGKRLAACSRTWSNKIVLGALCIHGLIFQGTCWSAGEGWAGPDGEVKIVRAARIDIVRRWRVHFL